MTKDEIKKIMKINDEINALILKLEKKQQESSNKLINIVLEQDNRISELEKEIINLKSRSISKPGVIARKSVSPASPIAGKVSLTDVLTKPGEKQPTSASITSSTPKVSIFTENTESSKTATVSRYGSVDVLKKRGGPSKFKPRTPAPPPKPEAKPKAEEPPLKKQNKEALAMLENLKSEITEETTTHTLQKILEEVRDDLAEIIGFSSIIRDIGAVSGKLKHAPDLPMDSSSIEAFRKKVDQWKSKV